MSTMVITTSGVQQQSINAFVVKLFEAFQQGYVPLPVNKQTYYTKPTMTSARRVVTLVKAGTYDTPLTQPVTVQEPPESVSEVEDVGEVGMEVETPSDDVTEVVKTTRRRKKTTEE